MDITKLFKKTTVFVVRIDNNNKLQDSAPCQNCLNMMIYLDIKRIVFSSKDNTFISENPNNLTINHESAGNKFLRKNSQTNNSQTNNSQTNKSETNKSQTNKSQNNKSQTNKSQNNKSQTK